ncbi:MAG: hypothetical protein CYPHOPRED_002227 [Cyphobasidiales sp. Tagirdzhanova-0007]|nr:MAG: hypothetical protein CYPHOPRED_002227 [Cyphobasidiales sp. Tagirdzhanova-0007]
MSSPIQVTVIGAGLGGLAAAIQIQSERYQVTVIESAAELIEIGAGVQITPQTVRQFKRWGIDKVLEPLAAQPKYFHIIRYSDGKILAEEPDWRGWQEKRFGSGVWDLHRADMQLAMFKKAQNCGVKFKFGLWVENIDCEKATITLKSGEVLTADLIVAADGLNSKARNAMLGRPDPPLPTGDLAYRIVLNDHEIEDPELRKMMTDAGCRLYAGPKAHVIMYSLKGGKQMNIVLLAPDDLPATVSRQAASTDEMMSLFDGWDPVLRKFLSLVTSVDKWRLMHHGGLESWHHPGGRVVMIGDAVHPMLPYLAQGANSAVEDGIVLGECLQRAKGKDDILTAIKVFEKLRKPRSERVVNMSATQRDWNHLDNGPEQEERDSIYNEQSKSGRNGEFPSAWINPELWGYLCSYDAVTEVKNKYDTLAQDTKL